MNSGEGDGDKRDETRREDGKPDDAKRDDAKGDGAKRDDAKGDGANGEGAKRYGARRGRRRGRKGPAPDADGLLTRAELARGLVEINARGWSESALELFAREPVLAQEVDWRHARMHRILTAACGGGSAGGGGTGAGGGGSGAGGASAGATAAGGDDGVSLADRMRPELARAVLEPLLLLDRVHRQLWDGLLPGPELETTGRSSMPRSPSSSPSPSASPADATAAEPAATPEAAASARPASPSRTPRATMRIGPMHVLESRPGLGEAGARSFVRRHRRELRAAMRYAGIEALERLLDDEGIGNEGAEGPGAEGPGAEGPPSGGTP